LGLTMSRPCTELLLFNYAKINSISHSRSPLINKFNLSILHSLLTEILAKIYTKCKYTLENVACFCV